MEQKYLKAMMFGSALGDGWLSESYVEKTKFYQFGFSGDKLSMERLKQDLIDIYGDIGKATIRTEEMHSEKYHITGITSQFVCNQKVANDFVKMGLPIGKRVEKEWHIPKWILNGSKKIKIAFLSGWYAAEGYTPAMQKNDITLKVLGFNFYKRKYQLENQIALKSEFSKILNDLEIEFVIEEKEKFTCDWNIVTSFIIKNNHNNLIHTMGLLDLRYCIHKDNEFKIALKYYLLKEQTLKEVNEALNLMNNSTYSYREISEIYGLNLNTLRGWKRRNVHEAKLPNTFIKYTQFKNNMSPLRE